MFRLYRGPLLVIQFIFLLGINVYGWRSSGVNHVLIFEMDPRHHLSEQHIMELAAIFGVVWALSVLGECSGSMWGEKKNTISALIKFVVFPDENYSNQCHYCVRCPQGSCTATHWGCPPSLTHCS